MTNTVKDFVEAQNGTGFNEKFENMVLYCMANLPKIEAELAAKTKKSNDLAKRISQQESLLNSIERLKSSVENAKWMANELNKQYDTDIT